MGKQETPSTLAARVKHVRGFVPDMSRRELSRIAGLSPSMVGMIERGAKTVLESDTAESLAAALGVSLDWLLGGRGMGPIKKRTTDILLHGRGLLPPPGKSGPKPKALRS